MDGATIKIDFITFRVIVVKIKKLCDIISVLRTEFCNVRDFESVLRSNELS